MPSSTNQKRGEKKRKIRPFQPTYIIRGDDALGIPEMRGEIGPSVKMVKPYTQGVVHNLFMIANATLEADEKFKDFDEFFAHGYEFLRKMTVGLDVPNYSDVRNSTLSYLYLQRTVEDIFETGAMAYIGINDTNKEVRFIVLQYEHTSQPKMKTQRTKLTQVTRLLLLRQMMEDIFIHTFACQR